jgi:hypothetical protein
VGRQHHLRVRQGTWTPSLAQTTSAAASAIARRVVALPPVMVTNPSTPSLAWSKHLKVRESCRPLEAPPAAPTSGLAADQAARNSAVATAGTSLAPSRYIAWTCSSGTSRSSGSVTTQALVPTTDRPRWGRTMSPSPAGCRRLTTRSQSRPRSASSTPGDGRTGTSAPAMAASRSHHGPVALTTRSAWTSASRPARWSWTATPVTRPAWRSRPVTSVNGRRSAPLRRAVAKNRSGSRMASMVASGTHTAAFSAGVRPGSSRSASAAVRSLVGMSQAAQAARKPGR